jgi:cell division ATPase FtsA
VGIFVFTERKLDKNVGRCIQSSGIELSGLTEPLASADAVLSQEEKKKLVLH